MGAQPVSERPRRALEIRPLTPEELRQIHDHDWLLRDPERFRRYADKSLPCFARPYGEPVMIMPLPWLMRLRRSSRLRARPACLPSMT